MAATQVNLLQLRSGRLVDFLTLQVVINPAHPHRYGRARRPAGQPSAA